MGTMAIPQGESHEQFKTRCCNEFESIVKAFQGTAALIVHGGTIMAVLEKICSSQIRFLFLSGEKRMRIYY